MVEIPIAVLISGRGSNLEQILAVEDQHRYRVAVVIADRAAPGLDHARARGIPVEVVPWSDFDDRASFTAAVCDQIERFGCELVVLAGFMRILAPVAIERFSGRILNVHPSLLPAFPGAHAVEDALAARVDTTGVTVHLVVEEVDAGPILAQVEVPVLPDDDATRLHARIQEVEHELFPQVIASIAERLARERGAAV